MMRLQLLFLAISVILIGASVGRSQCPGGVCPINQPTFQPTFQIQPITYTVRENLVVTTLPVRRVSLVECDGGNCGVSGQPIQTVSYQQPIITESTPVYRERPRLFQRVRLFSGRCSSGGCR